MVEEQKEFTYPVRSRHPWIVRIPSEKWRRSEVMSSKITKGAFQRVHLLKKGVRARRVH